MKTLSATYKQRMEMGLYVEIIKAGIINDENYNQNTTVDKPAYQ